MTGKASLLIEAARARLLRLAPYAEIKTAPNRTMPQGTHGKITWTRDEIWERTNWERKK
jgi:hypothetical protein